MSVDYSHRECVSVILCLPSAYSPIFGAYLCLNFVGSCIIVIVSVSQSYDVYPLPTVLFLERICVLILLDHVFIIYAGFSTQLFPHWVVIHCFQTIPLIHYYVFIWLWSCDYVFAFSN